MVFPSNGAFPPSTEGLLLFYEYMFKPRGFGMPDHLLPVCHALMDRRITKLLIIVGPGAGKSSITSITFPAFMIGHDPTTTVLNISAGEALPQGFQRAVGEWIENDIRWRTVFPAVRPDKSAGWSSERGLFVTGRRKGDPDASYFATGLTSSALTGKHARLIMLDDVHNRENASTSSQCLKVRQTFYDTIMGRADPQGARMIVTGRRWRQDDLYGHLAETGEFLVMELAAERTGQQDIYWNITIPDDLTCVFNDGTLELQPENAA